jgi:hypothetical protein
MNGSPDKTPTSPGTSRSRMSVMEPNEAAKRAFVAYRQLDAVLEGRPGYSSIYAAADTYDRVLKTLQECFSIDSSFADAVKHIKQPDRADKSHLIPQLRTDGEVLRATAHAFIELYLSPEEKKKAIGFGS